MNDDVTKKSIINIELPESIDNAAKNLTDKPTATIGETISDCLFLVFGGINQKAAIKRTKYAVELEKFKNELEEKLNSIPENKRQDANTHTVCTALENMKYCVEEKKLRNMFSSLIANSINSDKTDIVHPSFGEIIKQLSSLDAVLLNEIMEQPILPIISINSSNDKGGEQPLYTNLIWKSFDNPLKIGASLNNLERLKLINITYEKHYTDDHAYDFLKQQEHIAKLIKKTTDNLSPNLNIIFSKGIIEITDFGHNFYNACT